MLNAFTVAHINLLTLRKLQVINLIILLLEVLFDLEAGSHPASGAEAFLKGDPGTSSPPYFTST